MTIIDHDPPDNLGGSPETVGVSSSGANMENDQFENVRIDKQEDRSRDGSNILDVRNVSLATGNENDNLSPQNIIFPVSSPAPSVEECSKPAMSGKPVVVVNAEDPTLVKRDNKAAGSEILSKDTYIFKRWGKCITHGCEAQYYRE